MNYLSRFFPVLLFLISCSQQEISNPDPIEEPSQFISGVDLSALPEISESNAQFYDLEGNAAEFLTILKEHGVNTVRLRLWVNPVSNNSGFEQVKQFSKSLKERGFKTWLTLHYSDTWAHPGQQTTPQNWQGIGFDALKDSLYDYTEKVMREIQPDYIQIGNEINTGILHPSGDINSNYSQFLSLLTAGSNAVREQSETCQIILHFAGIENANWFFNQVSSIDYDIIGLSYYPIWHEKSLNLLETTLLDLRSNFQKKLVIAETAYPFTLDWNDWTNNIIGSEEHLILPDYPASPEGQQNFIREIKNISQGIDGGLGFCYWGAELISWKGKESKTGSPWENQALFDFDNHALPVLKEFNLND